MSDIYCVTNTLNHKSYFENILLKQEIKCLILEWEIQTDWGLRNPPKIVLKKVLDN
jgi:hypothetical protein